MPNGTAETFYENLYDQQTSTLLLSRSVFIAIETRNIKNTLNNLKIVYFVLSQYIWIKVNQIK